MSAKYIVFAGYVTSKNDGDQHFISSQRLMQLYGVSPSECVIGQQGKNYDGDLIPLRPRYDGLYEKVIRPTERIRQVCWPMPRIECFKGICPYCTRSTMWKTYDELSHIMHTLHFNEHVAKKELRDSMQMEGSRLE